MLFNAYILDNAISNVVLIIESVSSLDYIVVAASTFNYLLLFILKLWSVSFSSYSHG